MSGLQPFRTQLARLRIHRALLRWQSAMARGVVLVVVVLLLLGAMDFAFRLDTPVRAIVMLLFVLALIWYAARYILPPLSSRETLADIALLLERTNRVDSDLVAALQFDTSTSEAAGSAELRQAVVDRVARQSTALDFRSAVSKRDARRAMQRAGIAVIAMLAVCATFPDHADAFWKRLLLGNVKYPTRTHIDVVAVNGRTDTARIVEGEAVELRVTCSGAKPHEGIAVLRGIETGDGATVVLKCVGESNHTAVYLAAGPVLNEEVEYSLRIGDAETEPRRITLVHRPLVELTAQATPPAYTRAEILQQHEHYLQVVEGSAVALSIRCTNGKRLKEARFELVQDDKATEEREATHFTAADDAGTNWQLDTDAAGLGRVVDDFQFRITVVDEDGLATYHPIDGGVRIKADRPPTAAVASQHHVLMPRARPAITCTAKDDYGVGSIVLHARRASVREAQADETEVISITLALPGTGEAVRPKSVHTEQVVDLNPLHLAEGDRLLVWTEVTDDRGQWPGVSSLSEPLELEVMGERGVLDAILRSDTDAEQMLTDAIERELGLEAGQ